MQAAGLPELVTESLTGYEALALRLATEPGLLASYRARLEERRATCPLFDSPRYARHLEQAYSTMVERARAGLPPASFEIAPSAI